MLSIRISTIFSTICGSAAIISLTLSGLSRPSISALMMSKAAWISGIRFCGSVSVRAISLIASIATGIRVGRASTMPCARAVTICSAALMICGRLVISACVIVRIASVATGISVGSSRTSVSTSLIKI